MIISSAPVTERVLEPGPSHPSLSRVEGKSKVKITQMAPLRGGICIGVDKRNPPPAPGLPSGRLEVPL